MTHLIKDIDFPKENFILVKLPINVQDRLIFQNDSQPETEVIVTGMKDGKGLLKNWKIVSWSDNGKE